MRVSVCTGEAKGKGEDAEGEGHAGKNVMVTPPWVMVR